MTWTKFKMRMGRRGFMGWVYIGDDDWEGWQRDRPAVTRYGNMSGGAMTVE
jgi:hypothetical protein